MAKYRIAGYTDPMNVDARSKLQKGAGCSAKRQVLYSNRQGVRARHADLLTCLVASIGLQISLFFLLYRLSVLKGSLIPSS